RPQRLRTRDRAPRQRARHDLAEKRIRRLILQRQAERKILRIELVQIVIPAEQMRAAVAGIRRRQNELAPQLALQRQVPLLHKASAAALPESARSGRETPTGLPRRRAARAAMRGRLKTEKLSAARRWGPRMSCLR